MKLDKEINFITAEELLLEVENTLSTFQEMSLLDQSIFYPTIKRCLNRLGLKVLPTNSAVIQIRDYNGNLPFDFYKLSFAIGCDEGVTQISNENPQVYEVYDSDKFKSFTDSYLLKPNEVRVDESGDEFYVIQRYETFSVKYNNFFPLSLSSNSVNFCTGDCKNKRVGSPTQIDIRKGKITTNFASGSVYIEYLQTLEKETTDGLELLIPDFAPITQWIVELCIFKGLEKMYLNTEADVQQRVQYMEKRAGLAEANALAFVSRTSFKEMYDIRKLFFSRFNKYNEVVYGRKQSKTIYGPGW